MLAKAVEADDTTKIVAQFVKGNVPIDFREPKFGNTLLSLAVANDKQLAVTKLLELGANPNTRSFSNSSPFLIACQSGLTLKNPSDIIRTLLRYGADVNGKLVDTTADQFGKKKTFKATPLELACIYGNISMVKVLAESGANLEGYDDNENAILSTAVLSDKLDIVIYLMIEMHAPIPGYVVVRQKGTAHEVKMTITDLLNESDYKDDVAKQAQKEQIIRYLKSKGTN